MRMAVETGGYGSVVIGYVSPASSPVAALVVLVPLQRRSEPDAQIIQIPSVTEMEKSLFSIAGFYLIIYFLFVLFVFFAISFKYKLSSFLFLTSKRGSFGLPENNGEMLLLQTNELVKQHL